MSLMGRCNCRCAIAAAQACFQVPAMLAESPVIDTINSIGSQAGKGISLKAISAPSANPKKWRSAQPSRFVAVPPCT